MSDAKALPPGELILKTTALMSLSSFNCLIISQCFLGLIGLFSLSPISPQQIIPILFFLNSVVLEFKISFIEIKEISSLTELFFY